MILNVEEFIGNGTGATTFAGIDGWEEEDGQSTVKELSALV